MNGAGKDNVSISQTNDVNSTGGNSGLKKVMSFPMVILTIINMVIGSGIFFKAQGVFTITGGAPGIGIAAWIAAGLLSLLGGLTVAELAGAIPKTGGMVTWLEEIFGKRVGFLTGWVEAVVFWPANIGALGSVFAVQMANLFGWGGNVLPIVAIVVILFLMFMNCLGAKVGGWIGSVMTIAKTVPIILIIIFAFTSTEGDVGHLTPFVNTELGSPVTIFGAAVLSCMYSYDGWMHTGNVAGEMKNPSRDLPKAIALGLSAVLVIYAIINIAYVYVIPAAELAQTPTPAADVAAKIFGSAIGAKIVTVGIIISVFGTLNSNIMMAIRIPYVMGVQNKLPGSKYFSKLHPKYRTPIYSAVFITVITIIMTLSGSYNTLTDMCMFTIWIFYSLTFIGVIIFRKKHPEIKRTYKVPGYPVLPILAFLGGAFVVIMTFFSQTILALIGTGITLLGLIIYELRKSVIKDVSIIE